MAAPQRLVASQLVLDGTAMHSSGWDDCKANTALNVERGLPPMIEGSGYPTRPVAIVGYGPSLLKTWERLKTFPGPIWTVSKAHDFLLERGIVPTYHTDVDMRAHKAKFIKKPHPSVKYIIASHVHPDYLDNVAGGDVCLFHVAIDPKAAFDRRYPRMKVRVDASLMAAELAFWRGYAGRAGSASNTAFRAAKRMPESMAALDLT